MDWKNPADYEFTAQLDRKGWAWEFLRRNNAYLADFQTAQKYDAPAQYSPPKIADESDEEWFSRVIRTGGEPEKLAFAVYAARRWRMKPPIQDPNLDDHPDFLNPFPRVLEWDELSDFYVEPGPHAPIIRKAGTVVVAFDLRRPIPPQVSELKVKLNSLKGEAGESKKSNIQNQEWRRYLRILDAKAAGATNGEIIQTIGYYATKDNTVVSGYSASDRLSDNLQRAEELLARPLQILR